MNSDMIRYNLVTQFCCAKCGALLMLSYDAPKTSIDDIKNDGITGAAKVNQKIAIHPCEKCYGEAMHPLNLLREAIGITNSPQI